MHFIHIFHTICIGRDLVTILPKPTKRVALDSLARLVANAHTTAKSTGGAALLVPIRRCAAQLWQFCVGCAELCVVPKAEVDRAARMQHDPMMGRKNVSGGASKNN